MSKRIAFAALVIAAVTLVAWKHFAHAPVSTDAAQKTGITVCPARSACRHVYDMARALPQDDIPRFEEYMGWILRESDVDVRFVFVPDTGARSIEQLAVDLVDEMQIGGRTREERGVLLLYDTSRRRLKVEVGYGLEAYFPDAFVSYLVNDHARMFLEGGNLSAGLRLLLRLVQHRIREAVIGADFDPRVLQAIRSGGNLSGGAGIAVSMQPGAASAPGVKQMSEEARERYRAQDSPAGTFQAYLAWLAHPAFDPDVDLLTAESRAYLARLPISPAYQHFLLFGEYGKGYEVVQRDGIALLFFTTTPFTSPHFFVNEDGVWRMDIVAEVRDTRERVGGMYTWDYRGQGDRYTQAFSDLLFDVQGYRRFRNGDNRALQIRGAKGL
jgi:hypothetical protein